MECKAAVAHGGSAYAGRMQREMVGQIERVRPAFLVYVNVPASWLVKETRIRSC
jgi:hypothetical protein